jgi:biotin synthase
MGAAWRAPKDRDIDAVAELVRTVKDVGLEACVTLGMLADGQAETLQRAGLDYYNHNLDTSPEFYGEIITTRTYADRLETLDHVRKAGMKVCSGGIVGMGETQNDRAGLLQQLSNLNPHPDSVPINNLVKVEGTPLEHEGELDPFEFLRTIAVARILMPQSYVRLSAGRESMNEQMQALAFLAGANSIFYGEKLLTTPNPAAHKDQQLFAKLGINAQARSECQQSPVSGQENPLFYNACA